MDKAYNFAKSLISPLASGAVSVTLTDPSKFVDPASGEYNCTVWCSSLFASPTEDPNVEIVRMTAKSASVYTITRAQEGTSDVDHNSGGELYSIAIGITAKMITDIETELGLKEDDITYPVTNPETKFYRGDKTFAEIVVGSGGYAGNVYGSEVDSDVGGYDILTYVLPGTETEKSVVVNNNTVTAQTFLYPYAVDVTTVPSGTWRIVLYVKADSTIGDTTMKLQVFARATGGSETDLFEAISPTIENTADYAILTFESSQAAFTTNTTDRIGCRLKGATTRTSNTTINYIVGGARGFYFNTTLPTRHNQLRDLNGDNNFLHVTSTEKSTWSGKQDALGFTAENIANKSTNVVTDGASDTKYPSVKAIKDYADGKVAGLVNYRGAYDASVNTFPATGGSGTGGAILKGNAWVISVAGTLGGEAVQVDDWIIANVDTPGQTTGNWDKLNTNLSYVPEDSANKKTSITSSDTDYPTCKAVETAIGNIPTGLTWLEKITTYTAVENEGILADTTGGAWTLTLPATPTVGFTVGICDAKSNFATAALTIARNGSKIMSLEENLIANVDDASFLLIYTGATVGWKIDTYLPTADSVPDKATGAEVDTGTDDIKYITPKAMKDSGYLSGMADVSAMSDTVAGKVEAAIASEVNTGTDATRAITPDALAGATIGKRVFQIKLIDDSTIATTGDGKIIFMIPEEVNGMNLVQAEAFCSTVSSSGLPNIQVRNVTDTVDMLSTAITIDATEFTSYTATTRSVVDATHDDVVTGDIIAIDVDGAGTGTKGLGVVLSFQLP